MKTIIVAGKVIEPREKNAFVIEGDIAHLVLYNMQGDPKTSVKVDTMDVELLRSLSWNMRYDGYVCGFLPPSKRLGKSKYILLHNFLLPRKEGYVVDHINRDRSDNRRANLRYATWSQNTFNQSNVVGVSLDKNKRLKSKRWQARIGFNNKSVHLGNFSTKEEALEARRIGEIKYFREFVSSKMKEKEP